MKSVPKRMRQTDVGNAQRGQFFREKGINEESDFQPQYMAVANDIIKRIFDGEYRSGAKLPSMRTLAKKYGVSVQVILSAFQGLQSLHYIETRPKQGVYVSQDIRASRFYRVAVFVLNQNPFSYGALLYPLFTSLEEAGYTMIIGTNFDGGLRLPHWLSYKNNLDGLIILGTPTAKQQSQFKRIKVPYIVLGSPMCPRVDPACHKEVYAFIKWFVEKYIDQPQESRPLFLFNSKDQPVLDPGAEWADYAPENVYGLIWQEDGSPFIRKA